MYKQLRREKIIDWIVKIIADALGATSSLKIAEWARLNRTDPFDMGPKNYQRCLYDLGVGGKYRELEYSEDESLAHQYFCR